MRRDPFKVQKEEFLHHLHTLHKGHPVGDLDMGDMAAAKMLATGAMNREGVPLTVGETADLVGEMARAVGGDTKLAGQQVAADMDDRRRRHRAATSHRKRVEQAREMLTRKKMTSPRG